MFKLAVSTTLLTGTFASFTDISAGLNSTDAGLRSFSPNGGTWGFIGASIISSIKSYGCWCYFGSVGKGKSEPVDEIDGYCKQLQQGYECAIIDDSSCVPYEVTYTRPTTFGMTDGETVRIQCTSLNTDSEGVANQCAIDACTVETWFIMQMMSATIVAAETFKHDDNGGTFDVAGNCPITAGTNGEKSCCGSQPDRFAFKAFSGTRACCGTATYDTTIAQCCNEGGEDVVRLVCN